MSFEKYTRVFDGEPSGLTIRPKGKCEIRFSLDKDSSKDYRLFTVGETEQFYMWKDEPDGPMTYRSLTDALDTAHALRDRYCLSFTNKKVENYVKRIYRKITWPPRLSYLPTYDVPDTCEMGVTVSAKNLCVAIGGFIRMRVDIRKKKAGVHPRSVECEPDDSFIIDIPEGSYTGKKLSQKITVPRDTALVCVFIEGTKYKGECYFEAPVLRVKDYNLLSSFNETTADRTHLDWTAQNLSRKEWPEFRVRLNGKVIFTGEVFERSHRHSEWELALPKKLLKENNVISYELISDYHEPLPYTIYEAGIIERQNAELCILATSPVAAVGDHARVLIKTTRPNMRATLTFHGDAIEGKKELFFRSQGLHGVLIYCKKPCECARFCIDYDGGSAEGSIGRIAIKQPDRVITGTGDMIYVRQDKDSMEEYLSWYISNNIGELVTIRPTYRWSGTRILDAQVWKDFRRLMRELELKYVLMSDGREILGICANPDAKMLSGKGFLGIQMHERDGAQFYWIPRKAASPTEEQWADLLYFEYKSDPEHTASKFGDGNYYYRDGILYLHADCRELDDYVDEHKKAIASLSRVRRDCDTRHTGPACTFKYMAEAGYSWLGAETMYQTMEPIVAFLRGVAKERSMTSFGVHHALQWSSSPHESLAKYRRYRLALYVSYMLGATDINTEEGLWHLEEYYEHHHRFDDVCKSYLSCQQDFNRYVTSHSRSGKYYHPVALLHGRDDGVTFFGKNNAWGQRRPQTAADDSWDIIKAIYPLSKPALSVYRHGCPEDTPQGYHTGTPYGNVDIIPAEAREAVMRDYRALAFAGYNRCESLDLEKLMRHVKRGGRLLLTDAHLTTTSSAQKIREGALEFGRNLDPFCDGEPIFECDTVNGHELYVCTNARAPQKVISYTDSHRPLACAYRIGKGEIILFHTKEYPAHPAIRETYESQLKTLLCEECAKETIWAETDEKVEFTVWDQKDGSRHIYLLAVDWYNDPTPARHAVLRVGDHRYTISVPFGTMLKCVCRNGVAAWCESEDGEVLCLTETSATLQGTGVIPFHIAKGGTVRTVNVDFGESNVLSIEI